MGATTGIEWATSTFNPWWGCARISRACNGCYAETTAHRFGVGWGRTADRRFFGDQHWAQPLTWNRRAAVTAEPRFQPRRVAPRLAELAKLTPGEFRALFKGSPVERTRYQGFLRNVAVAMGNAGRPEYRAPLEHLADSEDAIIASHARWALGQLESKERCV